MLKVILVLLVVAGGIYFLTRADKPQDVVAPQEHAALTKMALESEAKAKQAAALAATDHVAEYEKQQQD